MTTQQDIITLANSLRRNGLAANDQDALRMAERMLGVNKSPEQRFREVKKGSEEQRFRPAEARAPMHEIRESAGGIKKAEEAPIKLEDIKPVENTKNINKDMNAFGASEESESGFGEIPVGKTKEKPTLTEEEKKGADLSKWFYCGKK